MKESLMEAGLDSLGSIQLRTNLGERFSMDMPATLALDFPNALAIATYIKESKQPINASRWSNDEDLIVAIHKPTDATTNILAISCMYTHAGSQQQFFDTDQFWYPILKSEDLLSSIPYSRWDIEQYYASDVNIGKMNVRFAAFISGVENFDSGLFKLSSSESLGMDPQVRILLEQHYCALQKAHDGSWMSLSSDTGIFVGVMHMEYIQYLRARGADINPAITIGNGMDFMIGRISYTFDLKGPCVGTHTACSSSLVATHLARSSLRQGECSASMASGVFLIMLPDTMSGIAQLNAFSDDGRCKTFDSTADGYGRGEGCAVVYLSQGDNMDKASSVPVAVLTSSAVNQAGKASSLTSPNGPAQSALISGALSAAGITPDRVHLTAVHGTGTALGDPIETGALGQALSCARLASQSEYTHRLSTASVKSCYGHTEGAAGLTGALLAIKALDQQVRPCFIPVLSLRCSFDTLTKENPPTILLIE